MTRVDHMPYIPTNDLNASSSLFSRKLDDKNIGTLSNVNVKGLSTFKISSDGSLKKLGSIRQTLRNIGDIFSSSASIATRNSKVAAKLSKLRQTDYENTAPVFKYTKSKEFVNSMQTSRQTIEQNLNNANLDESSKKLLNTFFKRISNSMDEAIRGNKHDQLPEIAQKLRLMNKALASDGSTRSVALMNIGAKVLEDRTISYDKKEMIFNFIHSSFDKIQQQVSEQMQKLDAPQFQKTIVDCQIQEFHQGIAHDFSLDNEVLDGAIEASRNLSTFMNKLAKAGSKEMSVIVDTGISLLRENRANDESLSKALIEAFNKKITSSTQFDAKIQKHIVSALKEKTTNKPTALNDELKNSDDFLTEHEIDALTEEGSLNLTAIRVDSLNKLLFSNGVYNSTQDTTIIKDAVKETFTKAIDAKALGAKENDFYVKVVRDGYNLGGALFRPGGVKVFRDTYLEQHENSNYDDHYMPFMARYATHLPQSLLARENVGTDEDPKYALTNVAVDQELERDFFSDCTRSFSAVADGGLKHLVHVAASQEGLPNEGPQAFRSYFNLPDKALMDLIGIEIQTAQDFIPALDIQKSDDSTPLNPKKDLTLTLDLNMQVRFTNLNNALADVPILRQQNIALKLVMPTKQECLTTGHYDLKRIDYNVDVTIPAE